MCPWHLESSFSHRRGGRLGTEVLPASMLNVTLAATGTEPCGWVLPSTAVKHYLQTPVRKHDPGTPSPSRTPAEHFSTCLYHAGSTRRSRHEQRLHGILGKGSRAYAAKGAFFSQLTFKHPMQPQPQSQLPPPHLRETGNTLVPRQPGASLFSCLKLPNRRLTGNVGYFILAYYHSLSEGYTPIPEFWGRETASFQILKMQGTALL